MSGQKWYKNLFTRGKPTSVPPTVNKLQPKEIIFTSDILQEIGPESPANNRIKTIQDLTREVMTKKLEENAIEALWLRIKDLTENDVCAENRIITLQFLVTLVSGQYKQLGILREHFFRFIETLTLVEDTVIKLDLLTILSDGGKDLQYFEDHAGPCLVNWMPSMIQEGCLRDFFHLLVGVVKFNAAYLDEAVISGLVKNTCLLTYETRTEEDLRCCLDWLDTVVCYSYLPTPSLPHFLSALCRIVNIPRFCNDSWELMRKLLGTHLGHRSIYTMCLMLQDKKPGSGDEIKRAAVYFIGMALWGSKRLSSLKYSHTSVLPSFKQALVNNNSRIIEYEVCLTIQRLVKKYGKDLNIITWDVVLDILEILLKSVESSAQTDGRIYDNVHDILTEMEDLLAHQHFMGSKDKFFHLIENCTSSRPESSVIMLMSHSAQSIHPNTDNWIHHLYNVMEKYFRHESRKLVRQKALNILSAVISTNKQIYEDDLIEGVVLPHLSQIENDPNAHIREVAADFIISLCSSNSPRVHDLFLVVEKMLTQPCKSLTRSLSDSMECVYKVDDLYTTDIQVAILDLIDLMHTNLYRQPPTHFLKVYDLLTEHMRNQYIHNFYSATANSVRKSVIECLLELRSDKYHRVGFYSDDSPTKFSPYILCKNSEKSAPSSPAGSVSPSQLSYTNMTLRYTDSFEIFISCLENERDWSVLKTLIDGLPLALQNKTLILSAKVELVDKLCEKVCSMVMNKQQVERFQNVPARFTRSDFHTSILPLLACLVSYHSYLIPDRQRDVIKCLIFGLMSKCAKSCVSSLRLATLEMQEVMMRLLPDVLLNLSKISATVAMAIPVLAFLSSLVRLPKMYTNFVEDQYMCVFAIALPYTNPFKFSQFAVSLAHHVIATWFIHSRLPFRKDFVKFIQKGLWANVQQQFKENALQSLNQNSSERSRAASYNEAALRRKRISSGPAACTIDPRNRVDDKIILFHIELTETCNEMMSRYVYGNYANSPKRSPVVEFLLAGGATESWLLGNKLITITTSGRGKNIGKWGLCNKCLELCQRNDVPTSKSTTETVTQPTRRRHKSAAVSRSVPIPEPQVISQDDINIRHSYSSSLESPVDDSSLRCNKASNCDDAAVQTGRSLTETGEEENIEKFLANMKKHSSTLASQLCNCWCTGWAEVYIRAPSGNISWVMRVQNEKITETGTTNELPLADISLLFAPVRSYDADSLGKIDSESLEEAEYESLYASHFSSESSDIRNVSDRGMAVKPDSLKVGGQYGLDNVLDITHTNLSPLEEEHPHTRALMRKSRSSPSIIGSDDGVASSPTNESSDGFSNGTTKDNTIKNNENNDDYEDNAIFSVDADNSFVTITKDDVLEDKNRRIDVTRNFLSNSLGAQDDKKYKQASKLDHPLIPFTRQNSNPDYIPPKSDFTVFPKHTRQDRTHHRRLTTSKSVGSTLIPDKNLLQSLETQLDKSESITDELDSAEVLPDNFLPDNFLPDEPRRRVHTISVMSPDSRRDSPGYGGRGKPKDTQRSGINPCSVFLQLYQSSIFQGANEKPLLLPKSEVIARTKKNFDRIYPHETHKIGVIYVGPGQANSEHEILRNLYGSSRYAAFLEGLGSLISLRECDEKVTYIGGLDVGGSDGELVYSWQDEVMHVVYHVATLMPNNHKDEHCNLKKRHIGNDFVTIVYNESGEDYKIGTIKGELNYVNIVIKPLDYESNTVTLQAKEDIADLLGHKDTKIISDKNLALLVRQIAVHCNLASCVIQRQSKQPQDPFASNWLERLRQIKRIKEKILSEKRETTTETDVDQKSFISTDFTNYS